MSELKPCPFCGYELPFDEGICPLHYDIDHVEELGICCSNCGVYVPGGKSVEITIEAWNTRADDRRIAELEDELDQTVADAAHLFPLLLRPGFWHR